MPPRIWGRTQPPPLLRFEWAGARLDLVRRSLLALLCFSAIAGCTKAAVSPSTPIPRSGATYSVDVGALGRPNCQPPSPVKRGTGFPEVEGTGHGIQLWGLVMAARTDDPVRVNEQVKIVWRITGVGELSLSSIGPEGRTYPLQWGPDEHLSSSYERPGQEWGAGYLFPQPGCWTLHAARGAATADVWLEIAP